MAYDRSALGAVYAGKNGDIDVPGDAGKEGPRSDE